MLNKYGNLCLVFFFVLVSVGFAKAQDGGSESNNSRDYSNSYNPAAETSTVKSRSNKKSIKKFRKAHKKKFDVLHQEFEARMRKVSKEKKKEAKMAEKPQYSNPSYFGHKRKPKIRPVGKRKFCKECHIVH